MRRFLSVIMAIVLIFFLASCSDDGAGKSVTYAIDKSPSTLDPQYAGETGAKIVINNVFEGLVRVAANGEVIPGIAENWNVSSDGMTYTFKLKSGTKWRCPSAIKSQFGQEFYDKFSEVSVTAHDFVFAMQRAVSPQISSPMAHRLFAIENATEIYSGAMDVSALGVSAPDDTTLIVKLREPCSDMLERFAESVFMPCNEEFFNATNGRYGLTYKHILCNGPFYVGSWDSSSSMTIRKNSEYAGEQEVIPASVVFSFDSSLSSIVGKLSSQTLSAALLPPDCEIPEEAVVIKENSNSVFGFVFNCSDSFLQNVNLRTALCSSVDRSLFTADAANGEIQNGFVPKSCFAGSLNYRAAVGSQTPELVFDKAKAAGLWQQGLSELGKDKATVKIICPERLESAVRSQIQIWQQTMGVSFAVSLEVKTPEEISTAVSDGDYQLALAGFESEFDSAVDFLASLEGGGVFRFDSAEFDLIIGRLLQVESDSDLLGGCFTAENYILQQGVFFPLYSRSSRFVAVEDVEGITVLDSEATVSFIGAKRYD